MTMPGRFTTFCETAHPEGPENGGVRRGTTVGSKTGPETLGTSAQFPRFDVDARRRALAAVASSAIHDFNNSLAAIMGHVSLARQTLSFDQEATAEDLDAALEACANARKLAKYLLAYLINSQPAPRRVALRQLLLEAAEGAQVLAGPTAQFTVDVTQDCLIETRDPDALFQAMLSLFLDVVVEQASSPPHVRVVIREVEAPQLFSGAQDHSARQWVKIVFNVPHRYASGDLRRQKLGPLVTQVLDPESPTMAFPVIRRVIDGHGGTVQIHDDATVSVLLPLAGPAKVER